MDTVKNQNAQEAMPPPARCPALLIAAAASGQGKTTLTAALARLHTRRGRQVRVFKCGPDFLDPYWLALASGAPVHALDLWINGESDCAQRLHAAAQQADLLLIEGAMGLFDGAPCAADLAQRFGVPVLAVIDAAAMAGSLGALAHGLRHYRAGLRWAGVLANRVGHPRHAQMLEHSLRDAGDWLGALEPLHRGGDQANAAQAALLPERHLGLVAAHELGDAMQRLDAAADALAATPLGQMTAQALAHWSVDFAAPAPVAAPPRLLAGRRVAVARDAAFCFIYAANLQTLESLGAQLRFFSPLADAALPDCEAVWLPGGYPELHAAQIAANTAMQSSLRAHIAAGRPLWAECGGMMALMQSIRLTDGSVAPLWGLLPGRVGMQQRLAAIGPQQVQLAGRTLRGHTFHYSTCESSAPVIARTALPGMDASADSGEALYRQGSVHAGYFHAWFASNPEAVAQLLGGGSE